MSLRKFTAVLFAVLALGAVLASSAFATFETKAAEIYEGPGPTGTTITGSRVANATIVKHTDGLVHFILTGEIGAVAPKVPIEFTATGLKCLSCTVENAVTSTGASVIATGKGKLEFTGVTVTTPTPCTATGDAGVAGTIQTKEITLHADFMHEGKAYVDFLPTTSGGPFATIKLSGTGCSSIAGSYNVTGTVRGEAKNATGVFAESQEIEVSPAIQTTTGGSLKLGNNPANLTGTGAFTVQNAAKTANISYAIK